MKTIFKDQFEFIRYLDMLGGRSSEYYVKREEKDFSYGIFPWEREIKEHLRLGIINLDKPPGPTSHEVAAWVKKMLALSKVGHAGTLEY